MENERRKFYRLPKQSKVELEILKFPRDENKKMNTEYKNIGAGGLLFNSETSLNIGEVLKLDISIFGWKKKSKSFFKVIETNQFEPLTAIAKVVRADVSKEGGYELGVEFVDVFEDDLNALISFIEEKHKKETKSKE